MDYLDVLSSNRRNNKITKFPSEEDYRYSEGMFIPEILPTFRINFNSKPRIFTIGSCFARNIEEALEPLGVDLPTKRFSAPTEEWPHRPNGMLNEFNPGSISQRILSSLRTTILPAETIVRSGSLFYDLLLTGVAKGVTYERAVERRAEIKTVYDELVATEFVIITLGYIEAWYDNETHQWLNRFPLVPEGTDPKRFSLKFLDVDESMRLLSEAMSALNSLNKKVLLSVSPVPIGRTFTNRDCVVANEFSKSVLRVCADRLCKEFSNVDYFPSYEMIKSLGSRAFRPDNVHVKDKFVRKVTSYMLEKYQEADGLPEMDAEPLP